MGECTQKLEKSLPAGNIVGVQRAAPRTVEGGPVLGERHFRDKASDACHLLHLVWQGRYKATWKWGFKPPWREAGPPNHLDYKVDSDE